MKEYNVKQIAEMLNTNPETVRRWIRSGKLEANQSSKKSGNIISEQSLENFVRNTPKYAGLLSSIASFSVAATAFGLPLAFSLPLQVANLVVQLKNLDNPSENYTADQISSILKEEIQRAEKSLSKKADLVKQLQSEIDAEKKRIDELVYALNNIDLENVASLTNAK